MWINGCLLILASHYRHSSRVKPNHSLQVKQKRSMFCNILPKAKEDKRDERNLMGGGFKTSDLDISLLLLKNSEKRSEWMGAQFVSLHIYFFCLCKSV